MKKKSKILILIIAIFIILLISIISIINSSKLKTISSEKELLNFYNNYGYNSTSSTFEEIAINVFGMPFSFINMCDSPYIYRKI